jgi:hypothetical protein
MEKRAGLRFSIVRRVEKGKERGLMGIPHPGPFITLPYPMPLFFCLFPQVEKPSHSSLSNVSS